MKNVRSLGSSKRAEKLNKNAVNISQMSWEIQHVLNEIMHEMLQATKST